MKQKIYLILLLSIQFLTLASNAQVSGIVYKDYNASGTRENTVGTLVEPLVQGITVKAYSATDALLATTTTDAAGAYSFTGLTLPVRIEFTGLPASYLQGCATNFTSLTGGIVQFITTATTTADFRINNPADYTQSNPFVVVAKNYIGDNNHTGEHSLVGSLYNTGTITSPSFTSGGNVPVNLALNQTVGNTWGVAFARRNRVLYTSAVVRHYFDYGTGGFDAIYGTLVPKTTPTPPATTPIVPIATNTAAYTINLSALGVTVGTDPRNAAMTIASGLVNDHNTYLGVGKAGIGDIDVSESGDTLYVINMLDGAPTLVVINVADPNAPTLISNNAITVSPCNNGVFRPWALKVHEGKVYIGGVCDGSTLPANPTHTQLADITSSVYVWNGGTSFTQVVSMPMNYARSFATIRPNNGDTTNADWMPWNDSWTLKSVLLTSPNLASSPQPILSDIEFTDDGGITLGIMDRFSMQAGFNQRAYNDVVGATVYSPVSAGDIVKFCNVSGSYILEGGSGCTQSHIDMGSTLTTTGNNIPDISEYYFDDFYNPLNTSGNQGHAETFLGAMAVMPGTSKILATHIDPVTAVTEGTISSTTAPVNTSGIRTFNSSNGDYQKAWVYATETGTATNRKGGQMGDLELIADAAPIEIGNRIWNDANGNGIQDAGEAIFANVTVELYLDADNNGVPDGAALATVTTDANGQYIFSNQITAEYSGADPGLGHAKFNIAGIVAKQTYIVRIGALDWNATAGEGAGDLAGYFLTSTNATGNGETDWTDNDASLVTNGANNFAQISVTTGNIGDNNHAQDFGFKNTIKLSGVVWNDINENAPTVGSPDGTEQVVNGTNTGGGILTGATLYANLINAGGNVVATTPILADGSYSFPTVTPNTTGLTIQLSTNQGTVGQPKPATVIPTGWVTTGENKNTFGGPADGTIDSEIPVTTVKIDIPTQNFGIQQVPESAVRNEDLGINPGGTNCSPLTAIWFETSNVGVNPNTQDYNGGTVSSIRLTAFPAANATSISVNGTTYLSTDPIWPANGGAGIIIPFTPGVGPDQPICIDPIDGTVTVVLPFASRDNANSEDPTPGSVTVTYSSTLPVSFLNIDAYKINNNSIAINWKVANQIEITNYEVQKSVDGINFSTIGTVAAANTNQYSFVDVNPVKATNYYRIKSNEINGSFKLTSIAKVVYNNITISTYPNPAKDVITVSGLDKKGIINVLSIEGKTIKTIIVNANTMTVNVNELKAGNYILQYQNGLTNQQTIFTKE